MKKFTKQGFTLIELLVVIAVIGILSSIVLVSLSGARDKGYDAQIKGELGQVRADTEIHYDNAESYTGYTIPTNLLPPACSDDGAYTVVVSADGQDYAAWANLCSSAVGTCDFCIDSTGVACTTNPAPTAPTIASPICDCP